MANTLKFGAGQWATKEGSTLAYNDENDNYKPLPFDFTRASSGTVVNKAGLIETVGNGIPRIDFLGNTQGALKLEPQRTNLVTYSEDFADAYWGKGSTTVSSNASISLDGTLNADLIYPNASGTTKFSVGIDKVTSGLSTSERINSVFVKSNNWQWIYLLDPSGFKSVWFDVINGVVGTQEANSVGTIEDYGNGWFRCSISSHLTSVNYNYTGVYFSDANGSSVCTNNSTDGVYLWGSQVEENYVSSYIPTNGSAVTRLADSCSQTVPDGVIGQTEGTMFFEAKINTQGTYTGLSLSDNTTNNEVIIRFTTQDRIEYYLRSGGTQPIGGGTTAFDTDDYVKVAFAYKSGDSAFYVNGTQVITSTTTTMPVSLSSLKFSRGNNTGVFEGRTKDLRVYNTRLTDQELIALTS
jgi:hypothetical protein